MPSTDQGEQVKLYILGGSALVGGVTLGWAASQGWVDEEKAFQSHVPTIPEEVGTWVAFNVGLVLMGAAYIEVIEEYGFAKVAAVSVAIPAVALAVRALRG